MYFSTANVLQKSCVFPPIMQDQHENQRREGLLYCHGGIRNHNDKIINIMKRKSRFRSIIVIIIIVIIVIVIIVITVITVIIIIIVAIIISIHRKSVEIAPVVWHDDFDGKSSMRPFAVTAGRRRRDHHGNSARVRYAPM
jgi:hypothetical protein